MGPTLAVCGISICLGINTLTWAPLVVVYARLQWVYDDWDGAEETYLKALEIRSTHFAALEGYATFLASTRGDIALAEKLFDRYNQQCFKDISQNISFLHPFEGLLQLYERFPQTPLNPLRGQQASGPRHDKQHRHCSAHAGGATTSGATHALHPPP